MPVSCNRAQCWHSSGSPEPSLWPGNKKKKRSHHRDKNTHRMILFTNNRQLQPKIKVQKICAVSTFMNLRCTIKCPYCDHITCIKNEWMNTCSAVKDQRDAFKCGFKKKKLIWVTLQNMTIKQQKTNENSRSTKDFLVFVLSNIGIAHKMLASLQL